MGRLTENDQHFGPITYGRAGSWRPLRLVLSSGGDNDEGEVRNNLTAYAFGWCAQINLPNILPPYRVKHMALSWDAATVARMGRNWYFETFPREYGFSLSDGFLQLFLGAQTHDSVTTHDWACHLPWTQWRFVRFSLYDLAGSHFWTQLEVNCAKGFDRYTAQRDAESNCQKASFVLEDFDGERITATTHIEEREWHFGTGWFKWLSLFRKPMIRRSLDIEFSAETGPEKGSWKGGTIGTGIDMLPGELHEQAMRRFCNQEHRSKYRPYNMKFIEVLN